MGRGLQEGFAMHVGRSGSRNRPIAVSTAQAACTIADHVYDTVAISATGCHGFMFVKNRLSECSAFLCCWYPSTDLHHPTLVAALLKLGMSIGVLLRAGIHVTTLWLSQG